MVLSGNLNLNGVNKNVNKNTKNTAKRSKHVDITSCKSIGIFLAKEGRLPHNPKVGSSILPFATLQSPDNKGLISLLPCDFLLTVNTIVNKNKGR